MVSNNDPRAGYCWFLRTTPARAHHLGGVFGGVDGDARGLLLKAKPKVPPQQDKLKGFGQSLMIVGTKIGGLPGRSTKKSAIGAAPFTPGAEKNLLVVPDSQERQEIRMTCERVDDHPSIDTDSNCSENILKLADRIMEAG